MRWIQLLQQSPMRISRGDDERLYTFCCCCCGNNGDCLLSGPCAGATQVMTHLILATPCGSAPLSRLTEETQRGKGSAPGPVAGERQRDSTLRQSLWTAPIGPLPRASGSLPTQGSLLCILVHGSPLVQGSVIPWERWGARGGRDVSLVRLVLTQ